MADTYKQLHQSQLSATVQTMITVGAAESMIIKHMTVVNNDTVSRTFAFYKNGTAAANIITPPAITIPAGGSAEWDGTMAMGNNDTLRGIASAATMLTATISGDLVT